MPKVKLTVTSSNCRSGYHRQGDTFIVEDLCPPICHELWNYLYPWVFALRNGAKLECVEGTVPQFDVCCPDGGRVCVHGTIIEENDE